MWESGTVREAECWGKSLKWCGECTRGERETGRDGTGKWKWVGRGDAGRLAECCGRGIGGGRWWGWVGERVNGTAVEWKRTGESMWDEVACEWTSETEWVEQLLVVARVKWNVRVTGNKNDCNKWPQLLRRDKGRWVGGWLECLRLVCRVLMGTRGSHARMFMIEGTHRKLRPLLSYPHPFLPPSIPPVSQTYVHTHTEQSLPWQSSPLCMDVNCKSVTFCLNYLYIL